MPRFIDPERLIHSTKTTIACLLGLLLIQITGLHSGQWIVISIIVVMCAQIYVGSVLQKAYLRFLGTLIGCVFAASAITFLGHTAFAAAVAIGVSSFIFSYLAIGRENLMYMGTLGAATTAIIMIGPQAGTLTTAVERFFEISIGILIAALVSQFILPIHARTHLRRSQANTLTQLRDYYEKLLIQREARDDQDLNEAIVKSLIKQRQLAKESAREPMGLAFDPIHFAKTLDCERTILRSISFMHSALLHAPKMEITWAQSAAVRTFNEMTLQSLDKLIQVYQSGDLSKEAFPIPTLDLIKQELSSLMDADEAMYDNGLLFSAEIMILSLTTLAGLSRISIQ